MPCPSRILSATLLAILGVFGMGIGAASAADPTPAPGSNVVVYDGTSTVANTDDGTSYNYPAGFTVDCTGSPCTITGFIVDTISDGHHVSITGGRALPFVGGAGTYDVPALGNICDEDYIGAFTLNVAATGNQMNANFPVFGQGEVDCGNGSTVDYGSATVTIVSTVTSGDPCWALGTCATPTPTPTAAAAQAANIEGRPAASVGDISGTTFSSPSTLSTLPTLASAISVANTAWAAVATTVLVVLIALPSHLINVSVEQGTDRFTEWWRRRRAKPETVTKAPIVASADAPAKAVRFAGWPLAAGGLLIASLISSFVSPAFGFNGSSVRVFLSILVSFLIDAAVGWFIVIWLVRRTTPTATAAFRFVPITLVIVAAAVVFSRLTGFQPGIVFGLVAGVIFGSVLATADRAKVALVPLAYSFAAAIVAWILYSVMSLFVGDNPSGFLLFLQETLSSVTIAGIAALPIALVPLRGLAGYDVFHWNRWVWGAAYALGMFGFFFVLMPKPFSWGTVGLSIWVWGALFLLYALIGVGLWLLVVKPWKKPVPEQEQVDETAPVA